MNRTSSLLFPMIPSYNGNGVLGSFLLAKDAERNDNVIASLNAHENNLRS